jgi:hypothetical protein
MGELDSDFEHLELPPVGCSTGELDRITVRKELQSLSQPLRDKLLVIAALGLESAPELSDPELSDPESTELSE